MSWNQRLKIPSFTWNEVDKEDAAYRLKHGVEVGDRKRKGGARTLHSVFCGNEAVDFAVEEWNFPCRDDAVALLSDLMSRGYFYKAGESGPFQDSRSFYSWSAPIEVAAQEFAAPVVPTMNIEFPPPLPDRDSWALYGIVAVIASSLVVSVPAVCVALPLCCHVLFCFFEGKEN